MKIFLSYLILLLYWYIGSKIFEYGVESFGGYLMYMNYIKKQNPKGNPYIFYLIAGVVVSLFWPFFIIKALIDRGGR